jgi:hypothetical protein
MTDASNKSKNPSYTAIGQHRAEPEDGVVLYAASGYDTKAKQINEPTRTHNIHIDTPGHGLLMNSKISCL